MPRARAWLGLWMAAVLALSCDPEPDVTYMAVGAPQQTRELERGTYQMIVVSPGQSATLQINLLGKSQVALGYIEDFQAVSGDETLLSVEQSHYSHGHRTYLKAVAAGTTTLSITTPTVSRQLVIRIED